MDSASIISALADEIVCECGNSSNTEDFDPPYSITWVRYVENYEIYGHTLEPIEIYNSGENILWDGGKDTRWHCGRCHDEVKVPNSMKPIGGW